MEAFETFASCSGPAAESLEALEARLALAVDLAAVELGALGRVAQNLVGGVDLGELVLRLGVVLVAVGVIGLGELTVGLLDLRFRGGAGDAEDVIRIAHHPSGTLGFTSNRFAVHMG